MAVERHYDTITVIASQDLTGHLFKAVGLHGGVGVTAALSAGILRSTGLAGEHVTLAYRGQMKAICGAAIASNALVTVTTSGFMITYTPSGSGGLGAVGRAIVQAGSGDIFGFIGDFQSAGNTA